MKIWYDTGNCNEFFSAFNRFRSSSFDIELKISLWLTQLERWRKKNVPLLWNQKEKKILLPFRLNYPIYFSVFPSFGNVLLSIWVCPMPFYFRGIKIFACYSFDAKLHAIHLGAHHSHPSIISIHTGSIQLTSYEM